MDANYQKVLDWLNSSDIKKLTIPPDQRDYVWKKEQIETFLGSIKNGEKFFGTILLEKRSENDFYVWDGQQRIITLSLIIISLYNKILKVNQQWFEQRFFPCVSYFGQDDKPNVKLKLIGESDNLYKKIICDNTNTKDIILRNIIDNNSGIMKSFNLISDWFKKKNEDEIKNFLNNLSQISVCIITGNKDDDCSLLYKRLNSTGLPLMSSDLIKTHVFQYSLKIGNQDKIYEIWKEISKDCEGDEKDSNKKIKLKDIFFRVFLSIQLSEQISTDSQIFQNFEKWWGENINAENNNDVVLLEKIKKYSNLYSNFGINKITNITKSNNDKLINKKIEEYKKIRNVDGKGYLTLTLMFPLIEYYLDDKINAKILSQILEKIISLEIRRCLSGGSGAGVSKKYVTISKNIKKLTEQFGFDNIIDFYDFSVKKSKLDVDDEDIVSISYKKIKPDILKLILKKINPHLNGDIIIDDSSIEHIMPQDRKKWKDTQNLSDDEYEKHINKLGNLMITPKILNSTLSNKSFKDKLNVLKNPSYTLYEKINQDVFFEKDQPRENWTIDDINERDQKLKKLFFEFFPKVQISNDDYEQYDNIVSEKKSVINTKKPWTEDDIKQLITFYDSGIRNQDIADTINRSLGSIDQQIIKLKKQSLLNCRL